MQKEYKTPEELIDILEERGMIFSNPLIAKRKLNEINYFTLKGYNELLLIKEDKYKHKCDFNELINLYEFDKELKGILLEYLLDIEMKIKTSISNVISSKYGIDERIYLDKNNYDILNSHLNQALKIINEQIIEYGSKNEAVKYYKNKYGFIPFYVLSKCLTLGAIKRLFNAMKQSDQSIICSNLLHKEIDNRRINKVKNFIALIADVRNMCAHDEIIFNFAHRSIDIGILPEHKYFKLKVNKAGNVIQGRKDLLALFISMKYLMSKSDYNKFIQRIESLVNKYIKKSKVLTKNELLNYMNLPKNFDILKTI